MSDISEEKFSQSWDYFRHGASGLRRKTFNWGTMLPDTLSTYRHHRCRHHSLCQDDNQSIASCLCRNKDEQRQL